MPVRLIRNIPVSVWPLDVTAQRDLQSPIWAHAMLCIEESPRHDVTAVTVLRQFHMGPPLGIKRRSANAVAFAELTPDHQRQIKAFLDDRQSEKDAEDLIRLTTGAERYAEDEYHVLPDAKQPSDGCSRWRFSCVGLVRKAYEFAGIELLREPFPERTLDELKEFYPALAHKLDDEAVRQKIGLLGEGPWCVSLVGYLLHSLNRNVSEIHGQDATPYVPGREDSHFPRANSNSDAGDSVAGDSTD